MRLAVAIAALCAAATVSAQPQVELKASTFQPAVGSYFTLTIVTSEQLDRGTAPVFPELEGLEVDPTAIENSINSSYESVNGRLRSTVEYRRSYNAVALKEGRIMVPPITVRIGGQTYQTKATILVATPRNSPASVGRGNTNRNQLTLDDVVFLKSSINKEEVFEGEEVVVNIELWQLDYMGVQLLNSSLTDPTTGLTGFYTPPEVQTQDTKEDNGRRYSVITVRRNLYPLKPGDYQVGPWVWNGTIFANLSTYSKRLQTDRFGIKVKPLPEAPAGFSGAVGKFQVIAQLTPPNMVQGEESRLQVSIRGRGNPDTIGKPEMPKLPWAHTAEPEISFSSPSEQSNWDSSKTFSYSITPHRQGHFEIPEMSFTYFDPDEAKYKTDTFGPFTASVRPSGESERLVTTGSVRLPQETSVEILGQDINPIVRSAPALRARRSGALGTGAVAVFPPLAYGGFLLLMRRKQRFADDPRYARSYFARSKSKKRLATMNAGEEPADALFRAVIGFLADTFDVNEAGMTSADARQLLERQHRGTDYTETLVKVLRACERRRYGGAALSSDEVGALREGAERAMDALDAAQRGGRK